MTVVTGQERSKRGRGTLAARAPRGRVGRTVDTKKRLELVVILSSGIPETYFEVSLNNKPHKQYYQLSEAMKEYCLLSVE